MKQYKRICALFLTVCLLISAIVPAVRAEDAATEKTVEYSFLYTGSVDLSKFSTGENGQGKYIKLDSAGFTGLNEYYDNGTFNSAPFYYNLDVFNTAKDKPANCPSATATSLVANAYVSDWMSVKIKSPGNGKFAVTVAPYGGTSSAKSCNVYIFPATADKDVISGEITSYLTSQNGLSQGKYLGSLQVLRNLQAVTLGNFQFADNMEYIVVFQAAEQSGKSGSAERADLGISGLSLTYLGAGEPDQGDIVTTVTHSFRYMELVTTLSLTNGYAKWTENNIAILESAYAEQVINSAPSCFSLDLYNTAKGKSAVPNTVANGISANAYVGDWVAVKIKSPGVGNYAVSVTPGGGTASAASCNVYVFPAAADKEVISGEISSYLANQNGLSQGKFVGSLKLLRNVEAATVGNFQFAKNEEYIVVFQAAEQSGKSGSEERADLLVADMTLTYVNAGIPDQGGEGNDNPGDSGQEGGNKDNPYFDPIDAEIVAEDAIKTGAIYRMESSVHPVTGHDIIYVIFKGGLMLVYDLDTGEKLDSVSGINNTPRDIYVDADGVLWMCGSSRFLFKYDPVTLTGTRIDITYPIEVDSSFGSNGITADENGNLYFGTYNRGYLIKYDPKTNVFTPISDWLITDEDKALGLAPDAMYAGFGGIIYDNGYLYTAIDGDKNEDKIHTHKIIKYSIAEQKIVDWVDVYDFLGEVRTYNYLSMIDGVLIATTTGNMGAPIAVDITGKMKLIDIKGLPSGIYGAVSEKLNGKHYFFGYLNDETNDRCLFEYDSATRTATPIPEIPYYQRLVGPLVTVEGDDRLPGKSLLSYRSNSSAGIVDVVAYNIETKQTVTVIEDLINGEGSGNQLRSMVTDPSRENIYVGAYGANLVSRYNLKSGTVVKQIPTFSHQTDGLFWYDGYLYAGNYGHNAISRVDPETGKVTTYFALMETAFYQARMHAMTAGDGKVFAGTVPQSNRYGGVLVWYDFEKCLTYVAAGPNPEDVYYSNTYDWENGKMFESFTWYRATTGEMMDFDDNNDGVDDYNIIDENGNEVQRFTGPIPNQSICQIVYQDGYIYGVTSKHGGSGASLDKYKDCAVIFVYDVAAMKVIATYDLCDSIKGLGTPIQLIDALGADPAVKGKFWGVVTDTLFSFTFNTETGKFENVKQELSLGKSGYNLGGNGWASRDIVFDGDYMYVVFGSVGTLMVNKTNPQDYLVLSKAVPKKMVLGADDNLYFINNDNDLKVIRIAEAVAPVKDPSAAAAVQAMIDALDDAANITLEDEPAVLAARAAYEKLSEAGKALVKDTSKLTAAEAAIAPLRAAADKAAADGVIAQINAIGTVTADSEAAIKAARNAYNALTDAQKRLVSNLNVLETAEADYEALINAPTNPGTGDSMPVVMLLCIALISMIAIAAAPAIRKKANHR